MGTGVRTARACTLTLAVALVVTLLPVVPRLADHAEAQVGGPPYGAVNLLFSERGDPARYGANRLVRIEAGNINFVRGCPKTPRGYDDWFQPAADLYVVGSGTALGGGTSLGGRPRTVFGGMSGQFFNVPLAMSGTYGSGTYDVVVDECQNGQFDVGIDSVVRGAFRVDMDEVVPGFSQEAAEFARLKAMAGATARDIADLRRAIVFADAYETSKKIMSAASVSSLSGVLGFAVGEFVDMYKPNSVLLARAKGMAYSTLDMRQRAAANLRDDPPDPVFQQHAAPARVAEAITAEVAVEPLEALYVGVTGLDQLTSVEAAFLRALERYQGAQLAGNPRWALRHARSLEELAALHAELAPQVTGQLQAGLQPFRAGSSGSFFQDLTNSVGAMGRAHPTTNLHFWNSGAELDRVQEAVGVYRELADSVMTTTVLHGNTGYAARGQAAAGRIVELSAAMSDWTGAALPDLIAHLEDQLGERDVDPVAVIAEVSGAAVGGSVVLDGSGSLPAPDGTPVDGWAWDLDGDGEFDDATGPTPTWEVPGDALAGATWLIGLRVTAGDGLHLAHQPVTVVEGNRRPELVLVDPGPRVADAGDTVVFEVASATDPDGDPVTLAWLVDEEVVEGHTGTSYTMELPDDTFRTFRVDVVASDPHGARVVDRWGLDVRVRDDADRDGYFAWPGPDCDDSDPLVHPGRPEVLNNGKDDDCDPGTPDDGDGSSGNPGGAIGWYFDGVAGDATRVAVTGWHHASRYVDTPFTMTVEWADGTTSQQTVQGTTYEQTVFELEHRYTGPVRGGEVSYCITYSGGLVGCNRTVRDAVHVSASPPFVGAADLRAWSIDRAGEAGVCLGACDRTSTWRPTDPDGRAVISTGNPNEPLVMHSPVELAEDGYGRAVVELSSNWQIGGDDDSIGFVLGYLPEEIADFAISPPHVPQDRADLVGFQWGASGRQRMTTVSQCSGGDFTVEDDVWGEMATVWRQRGMPLYLERAVHRTFDFPETDGQDPRCNDAFGLERLAVVDPFPEGARVATDRQRWLWRTARTFQARPAPQGPLEDPYTFTIDYRADRLRIWIDGQLIADIAPTDPSDPFPPGALGLFTLSNPATRASATAPEPGFSFVQGTPGPISMPMIDGDGPNDTHTAIVDWGDGSPQSYGDVALDPGTGYGWFEITAEHAYQEAGEFRGEVCVVDDGDRSSCFTFRATVENLPPVVDAGPKVLTEGEFAGAGRLVTGARVTLDQASFTDPGLRDVHTATIDWGDGSEVEDGEVGQEFGGGTVTGTHEYAEDGTYTVAVCVTDQHGATGCDTLEVEVRVTNAAPVALLEVADGISGVPVTWGLGFTDDDPDDTHEMTYDPGDGTGPLEVQELRAGRGFGQATVQHTYAEPGTYTVTACVVDQDVAEDCTDAEVTVEEGLTFGPFAGVDEGDLVALAGSFPVDDVERAGTIDPGDGSAPLEVAVDDEVGSFTVDHVFRDDGTYTIVAELCDGSDRCATATSVIEVANVAPIVDAGRDRTADGVVTLDDTTFTDPGVDDTHTATVDWGEGGGPVEAAVTFAAGAGTVQASHVYDTPGSYTVEVCVTDDAGDAGCDRFEVTVLDPSGMVVTVEQLDDIDEGDTVEVPFAFTDEDEGGPYVATVRWSDGSGPETVELDGTTGTVSHRYLDDGVYAVTVEICDGARCGAGTTSVTVVNVAPTVAPPIGTVSGRRLAITAAFTDPGELDSHTATVAWGDGTSTPATITNGTVTGSRTYASDGIHTVEVCVADDAGGTGCSSAVFEVARAIDPGGACPPGRVPRAGFADTVSNTHESAIDCAAWYGLARGRTASSYVPGGLTTRQQMASFLVRLLREAGAELPEGRAPFTDLAGGPHDAAIGALYELGIVRGTTATTFGPWDPVRRDQMAAFVVRTYEHLEGSLAAGQVGFTDIDGNVHRSDIQKAATAGFALGRDPTRYRPHAGTRRDQMASFLTRVLERLHDAGRITPPDRR